MPTPMAGQRRAVIFDMDGVLVLSGPAHWLAWRQVAAEHGLELTRERFLSFNGLTNQDICRLLWGARATPEFTAALAERKERAFRDQIAREVPLAPGCRELLAAVQQRACELAVGSSAPVANVDRVLDGGGIRPFFGAVVHGDMVVRGKPAPDIFLRAAHLLGRSPAECVVVEDAPTGVRAAVAAGMRAVGVLTNHTADELRAAGAAAIVAALDEIAPDLLLLPQR
ncbi:MAG: HAD family phosphatase [Planctomycetes bacterium]|nr:HAD family phosphatase [Planctomycetota bacterium]